MCIQQFQAHLPICQARLSHPTKRNAFKGTISEVTNKGVAAVRSLLICWVQKLKLPEAKVEQLVCLGEFEVPKFRSVTKQGNFSGGFDFWAKLNYPIRSMYGIFTYIWLIFMVNVGKYTSPMDGMGIGTMSDFFSFWKCNVGRNKTSMLKSTLRIIFWAQIYVTLWHPNILEHWYVQ